MHNRDTGADSDRDMRGGRLEGHSGILGLSLPGIQGGGMRVEGA